MRHVLIAEDEKGVGLYLTSILNRSGYKASYVGDGLEALEIIKKNFNGDEAVELLISDVNMPGINGLELLDKLNEMDMKVPSIIITASEERDVILGALRKGCYDFVDKPIDESDVLTRVAKVLKKVDKERRDQADGVMKELEKNIPNNYKLINLIGEGISGTVYLIESRDDHKQYALKLLKLESFDEEMKEVYIKRFINEGFAISQLHHPNIINFIEFGYSGAESSRSPYIIMEYFKGMSLGDFMTERSDAKLKEKLYVVRQIAEGLAFIHAKDILHRDIKPGNILIDEKLNAKITDFGICGFPNSDLTMNYEVLGSPGYVAPEYWLHGTASKQVDIYSLGVVAYELLTGAAPFKAESLQQLRRDVIFEYAPAPSDIVDSFPLDLQEILGKMMRKNPKWRYKNARDLVDDLIHFEQGHYHKPLKDKLIEKFFCRTWKKGK